ATSPARPSRRRRPTSCASRSSEWARPERPRSDHRDEDADERDGEDDGADEDQRAAADGARIGAAGLGAQAIDLALAAGDGGPQAVDARVKDREVGEIDAVQVEQRPEGDEAAADLVLGL